nr:MAG TPA: hypothetical protein [Bacteriophage sp.]
MDILLLKKHYAYLLIICLVVKIDFSLMDYL